MDPVWVSHLEISPAYLPQAVLHSLADSPGGVFDPRIYRMMIQVRYADWFLPGSMILLVTALSLFFAPWKLLPARDNGGVDRVRCACRLAGHQFAGRARLHLTVDCSLVYSLCSYRRSGAVLTLTHALGTGEGMLRLLRKLFGRFSGGFRHDPILPRGLTEPEYCMKIEQ
jgi:hypothetical protein